MADYPVKNGLGQDILVDHRPTPYLGQVMTKSRICTNRSTGNKQGNSKTHHVARDDIYALQVVLPNWCWLRSGTGPETAGGGNITYSCALDVPGMGARLPFRFGGALTGVAASNTDLVSDILVLPTKIKRNRDCLFRTWMNAASAIVFTDGNLSPASPQCDIANGEAFEYAASGLTDKTLVGEPVPVKVTPDAAIFSPLGIIAYTRQPSFLFIGSDSRGWGFNDTFDGRGDIGELARTIGRQYGYINMSCPGDTLSAFNAGSTRRRAYKPYVSHVVVQAAINGLRSGGSGQNKSAATVLAEQQTALAFFADKKRYVCTTCPQTTSSDAWATIPGQTVNANSGAFSTFNAAIRAGVANADGYFDIAAALAPTDTKWDVPGLTLDGLHTLQGGYQRIASQRRIDNSRFSLPIN